MPKYISIKPTKTFKTNISESLIKSLNAKPSTAIRVKNVKEESTHPPAKTYVSFLPILSSLTFVEKTPAQKRMVSGFEAVSKEAYKNTLLVEEKLKLKLGNMLILKLESIEDKPKIIRTTAPNIFKISLVFSEFKKAEIPLKAKKIYSASIRHTANTAKKAEPNPLLIAVFKTYKHTGPIASWSNRPNLKPLNSIYFLLYIYFFF